jgi:hypothetical protein
LLLLFVLHFSIELELMFTNDEHCIAISAMGKCSKGREMVSIPPKG